jgi:hypothetical protein
MEEADRVAQLVASPAGRAVAVVGLSLAGDGDELDWVEAWEVAADTTQHSLNEAISSALEEWEPLATPAQIRWVGSSSEVFDSSHVRRVLVQLSGAVASMALQAMWRTWLEGPRSAPPSEITDLMRDAVGALREHRVPDWERGWELSGALSRLGFLLSLEEDRLLEARDTLNEARERGPADGWVTEWNQINVAFRLQDLGAARGFIADLNPPPDDPDWSVHVSVYVPGVAALESVLTLDRIDVAPIMKLLRVQATEAPDPADFVAALADCQNGTANTAKVAAWYQAVRTEAGP